MTDNLSAEKQGGERLDALAAAIGGLSTHGPAPVETWSPPYSGDIDIRITADGTWYHAGSAIRRQALVRLFASVLRKDEDRYVLVTPSECYGIRVEDAPFAAVAMATDGDRLSLVTNVGDSVEVGSEHPLRFTIDGRGGVTPYVLVRGQLWARLSRSVAVEMLGQAEETDGRVIIRSGDARFPVVDG